MVYLTQYITQSVQLRRVLCFLLALVAQSLDLCLHVILNLVELFQRSLREATLESWPLALLDAFSELLVLLLGLLLLLHEDLKTLALLFLFFLPLLLPFLLCLLFALPPLCHLLFKCLLLPLLLTQVLLGELIVFFLSQFGQSVDLLLRFELSLDARELGCCLSRLF